METLKLSLLLTTMKRLWVVASGGLMGAWIGERAQRTGREILGQYIDDVAAAWNASAALRVFTLTTSNR